MVDSGGSSYYLVAKDFGFNIPSNATITSITVEWEKKKTGGGSGAKDNAVRIIKGGVIGSTDKSSSSEWPTSDTYVSYGGDLWGETWTPAQINSSNFGAAISGKETNGNVFTLYVDHVRITVCYNVPGSPSISPSSSISASVSPSSSISRSVSPSASASLSVSPSSSASPSAPASRLYYWNGTTWVNKSVKVWDGGSWVEKPLKVRNGGNWI